MKCKNVLLLLLLMLFCSTGIAAQQTVEGKVTDVDGLPLPGVNIRVVGTQSGALTDFDGVYSLKAEESNQLEFSYVGMETQNIDINNRTVINVVLLTNETKLNEIVLIGYAQVKKDDLTGAVSSIKPGETEEISVSSPELLLQGAAPGVSILNTGGAPGGNVDINVRGGNSLTGSNQPLIIIDGIEMDSADSFFESDDDGEGSSSAPAPSPLASLNPNDIESMDVLKDASATAIYGSRGANGVIIISTKKGKKGRMNVQLNRSLTISSMRKKIDVLDGKTWLMMVDEAKANDGITTGLYGNYLKPESYERYGDGIDWQDEIYRSGYSYDTNLSLRGGSDKTTYSISANHSKDEGIVIHSAQESVNLRTDFNVDVTDKFKIGVNSNYTTSKSDNINYSNQTKNATYSPLLNALIFTPYNVKWDTIELDDILDDGSALYNPLSTLSNEVDELRRNIIQSRMYGDIEIADGLSFKSSLGFKFSNSLKQRLWAAGTFAGERYNNVILHNEINSFDYLNENTLTYDSKKRFSKHHLTGVLGQSSHKWIRKGFSARARDIDIIALGYESFEGAGTYEVPRNSHSEWGLLSYYGRVNYTFNDKYLFTFTGRYDGSSRLAEGNQWAFFPSGAFSWKMDKENFLKNADWLSQAKLRLSYGASGNQSVQVGATIPSLDASARYPIDGEFTPGVTVTTSLANPDLTWETTYQGNIGLDLSFFKSRLSITADYYKKNTTDLLLQTAYPISGGFPYTTVNGGEVQNKGWEIYVDGDIIKKKRFNWNVGVSLSQNRSKLIDLGDEDFRDGGIISGIALSPNRTFVGGTVGLFYGYETDGIYQNTTETAAAPTRGGSAPEPGDIVYVDQQKEGEPGYGELNTDDRVVIGNPEADLIFGFKSNFRYKNFSFRFAFNGMLGNDVFNLNLQRTEALYANGGLINQTVRSYEGRWTGEGTSNLYPRLRSIADPYEDYSDRYVEDGSFLRLQNVSIAYNFNLPKKNLIRSIRPFISASNLFVLSSFSGYDPETRGIANNPLSPGISLGTYPIPTTIKFGASISF